MYGDTQVIRALARTMREQGDEVRREADHIRARAESVAWSGLAADAMRGQARARWSALRRAADRHDDAAEALERHADEVERVKALIAAIQREVTALVASARDRLASLAGAAAAVLGAGDPVDDLLDRFVPPPPGHRDWLAVDLPGLS